MPITSQFAQEFLAKLPEADRGAALAILEKAEAAEAVQFLDTGAKRQSDYSRHLDTLRAQTQDLERRDAEVRQIHEAQTAWWNENRQFVEAGRAALGRPTPQPTPAPAEANLPADVLRKDEVERLFNERDQMNLGVLAATNQLVARHHAMFGEILDTAELLGDPRSRQIGLVKAYEEKYAERITAKHTADETARINQLVETRLAEERRNLASRPPYPVGGAADLSPLDALTGSQRPDPTQFSAEAAADEYAQLAAKRVG